MDKYTFIVYEDDGTFKKVHIYSTSLDNAWETARTYYANNKVEYEERTD